MPTDAAMQSPSESASLSDSCECSHVCEPSSKMSKAASSRRLTTPRLARETTEQRCRRRSVQPPVCFAAASVWLPLSTSKRSVTEPSPAAQSRGRLLADAAASMECNRLSRERRELGVGQRIRQWHTQPHAAAPRFEGFCGHASTTSTHARASGRTRSAPRAF